ncbi:MAG: hypothetical protein M1823_003760 [Watsoniomyces obsoletus]|nr:MAG: hypothetical protein M1823_003760 [Watsoniomyces obsoletus]
MEVQHSSLWARRAEHLSPSTPYALRPLSAPSYGHYWAEAHAEAHAWARSPQSSEGVPYMQEEKPRQRANAGRLHVETPSFRQLFPLRKRDAPKRPAAARPRASTTTEESPDEISYDISTLCGPSLEPPPPSPVTRCRSTPPPSTLTWEPSQGTWIRTVVVDVRPQPFALPEPSGPMETFESYRSQHPIFVTVEEEHEAPPSYLESQLEEARRRTLWRNQLAGR